MPGKKVIQSFQEGLRANVECDKKIANESQRWRSEEGEQPTERASGHRP
jgi:hypothetical protein